MANATKEAEDWSAVRPGQALEARSEPVAPPSGRLNWLNIAAICAYSTVLTLAAAALLVRGPLHGAGPIRVLIPQPAMCAVVCVVWATVLWAPVSLHHRGNTILLVLEDVPLLLGLVFLSPSLLVLAGRECRCLRLLGRAQAGPLQGVLQRGGRRAGHGRLRCRLPRDPRSAQRRQRLGLRGSRHRPLSLCGLHARDGPGHAATARPDDRTANGSPAPGPCDAHGRQRVSRVRGARRRLDRTSGRRCRSSSSPPSIIVAYRGYTRLSLRFASLQRLYDFSRALGTANLEPISMSLEVLNQVCTVMRARRAQLILAEPVGHSAPDLVRRPWALRGRADQPRRRRRSSPRPSHRRGLPAHDHDRGAPEQLRPDRRAIRPRHRGPDHEPRTPPSAPSSPWTATRSSTASTTTISVSSRRSSPTPAPTSSGPVSSRNCASRSTASPTRRPTTCSPGCPTACCSSPGRQMPSTAAAALPSCCSTWTDSRTSTTRSAMPSATASSARCPSACCAPSASRPPWPVSEATSSPWSSQTSPKPTGPLPSSTSSTPSCHARSRWTG